MESVYDLIDELDVSADYLYKQHTGHRIFFDNGIDTSSESSNGSDDDSDSENKPPLFTYEEIMANLGDYNPDLSASGDSTQETPETIVRKLHQYITEYQCFICNGYGKKHYRQPGHFKTVRAWIEGELKKVKRPVDWELIFCQVCNQPLTGNEQSREHYSGFLHEVKASSFCAACLRVIASNNMAAHCLSKQHIQNEARKADIQSDEELKRDNREATEIRTKLRGPTVQTTSSQDNLSGERTYASVLRTMNPKPDDTIPVSTQAKTVSGRSNRRAARNARRLNTRINKKIKEAEMVRSTEPSVVKSNMEPRHDNMPNNNCDELGSEDVSDAELFYEGYTYVPQDERHKESFHKKEAVTGYDTKIQYSIETSSYYDLLMDNPANTSPDVDAYSSSNRNIGSIEPEPPVEGATNNNEEAIVDDAKKRRKRRRRKASTYSENLSSVTDEVSDTAETYSATPRDSCGGIKQSAAPMTPREIHANMYRVLYWLMRWNYCNICNEPVRRQEKGNHYKQKAHLRNFTQFIDTEGLNYGYTMTTIGAVYCLPCHTLFETPEERYIHYETEKHVRTFSSFCPICLTLNNCKIHKDIKQKITDIVDQYIIEQIGQGNSSVEEIVQKPEEAAKKNDVIINEENTIHKPIRSSNRPEVSGFSTEKTNYSDSLLKTKDSDKSGARASYAQTCTDGKLHHKIFIELSKTLNVLQMMSMEKRLTYLKTFNKQLREMRNSRQKSVSDTPINQNINLECNKIKCLHEVKILKSISMEFFNMDSNFARIPILLVNVQNLRTAVKYMVQTGNLASIEQAINFTDISSNKAGGRFSVTQERIITTFIQYEIQSLHNYIENQELFKYDIVYKCLYDFNEKLLALLNGFNKTKNMYSVVDSFEMDSLLD